MAALPWDCSPGLREQLADFYRDLHQHPELSLQEFRTAQRVAEALGPTGFEVTTEVGGTGVVGVLRNGDGPTVLLRADFDALPVEEKTGLPYASSVRAQDHSGADVPVMHACGHDMHATCLVGAATLLANSTAEWSGTVVAVFQPAEELACGARNMVADGLFERFPKPDIVLAQHVGPLPAGMIGYGSGPVMSGMDAVQVRLYGRGGHGSRPEAAIDTVLMAANVVTRLQGIVSREVPPAETAVVTVGRLQAGTKDNIIPDTAELGITTRTYDEKIRDLVRAAIERIVRAEATASGAEREPDFDWNLSAPVLVNDPASTETTIAAFAEHFGEQRILPIPQVNASEDAGVFGTSAGVPSVYWFWGGVDFAGLDLSEVVEGRGVDQAPANHSPEFAPEIEPTLGTGVEAMVVAARTWLGSPV
ncbi:amidohydrolase [Nocardia jiangxiensis]|uniref:amidohydrolase n=1 Tax=Nocardia jiangxiensis TaxID=282685 RepID=UPI0002DC47E6|nr:amidohydrolase [Nocardia jiangxiensis]